MWPITEWGAGQTPAKALEPTLQEQNAYDNTPVPAGAHVRVVGNMFRGYQFEIIQHED